MATFNFSDLFSGGGNLGNIFGGGMSGATPTGLDALLSEDQRKLLGRNATLSAAAALLQAGAPSATPIGLGQALGSALQAGQGAYEKARSSSFQDLLLGQKLEDAKIARDLQKQISGVFTDSSPLLSPEQQALMIPNLQLGPTKERAELAATFTPPSNDEILANQYRRAAQISISAGKGEDAQRFMNIARDLNPRPETVGQPFQGQDKKFYIQTKTGGVIPAPVAPAAKPSGVPQQMMGSNGQPVMIQNYDDGTYKILTGVSPLIPRVSIERGGSTQFMDPYSIPSGTVFSKTLPPQVVGNAEDGYFVVGGGARGVSRPASAVPAASTTPAAGATPAASGLVPLIAGTGKAFGREKDLRADYTKQMEPFIDLGQAFKKVEAAALNPSAAGDISMIYGYMKILDPKSTVMQGEQATASNAGGIPDRVKALYNQALNGERLAEPVRQDFYAQARNLIESQRELQQDIAARYTDIATQNKLNPNQIIFDPFKRIQTPAQIAADAARAAPPTEEEKKKKPTSFFDTYNLLKRN